MVLMVLMLDGQKDLVVMQNLSLHPPVRAVKNKRKHNKNKDIVFAN